MAAPSVSAPDIDATVTELAESKADEIIKEGTAFDYIYKVWQSRHHGDSAIGKTLILSIANGSISNAKGWHIQLTGAGGGGKSDAEQQAIKLIDPQYVLNSALTPQVLYYPTEGFVDGSIVFVDEITWNSELGVTIKRVTTDYQDGAERTVTTDGAGVRQRSPKRLTFWVTSVDAQCDEQLRDRFILKDIDESPDHVKEVIETLKIQDAGETTNPTDRLLETKVCHILTRDLRKLLIDVIIPYATRIEFTGDLRAYRMFTDMIRCFAIFVHAKREIDPQGRLTATIDDFENAKELYEELGGHSRDNYTTAETNVLTAIIACGNHATKADIQEITGLSSGRLGDILNGRGKGDQQKYGLLHRCPALVVDYNKKPYQFKLPAGFKAGRSCHVSLKDDIQNT